MYEIWISRHIGNGEFDREQFIEDCQTYEEAVKARAAYQANGDAACIQNKETGEIIK